MPSLLILCSGLGIIFGAFGSTATAKYKGVVITGVAAIAAILLVLVDYLNEDDYVELEIKGDIKGAQIEVVGDVNYLGAPRDRSHNFIVIANQIRRKHVTVSISLPQEIDDEREPEFLFECIDKNEIERRLGSGQVIQWRFDKESGQIFDSDEQRKIGDVGGCPRTAAVSHVEPQGGRGLAGLGLSLLSEALAAEVTDTQTLLRDMEDRSPYTRRQARESLVKQGLPAAKTILNRLTVKGVSYQARLGVVVAMAKIMRESKNKRQEISELLTEDHLNHFIDASADKDRTIRTYASEFLYDLADTRVVPKVLERFETADDNGKYSLMVVLEGTYPYLDDDARTKAGQKLSAIAGNVGPKTEQLIKRITRQAMGPEQRYWVVVGSYTDQSLAQAHAEQINEESEALEPFVGERQPNNPYYPVIVGDYVSRQQGEKLLNTALQLKSVREYGIAPYLSAYADRKR